MCPKLNPLPQRCQHYQIQQTSIPQRQSGTSPNRSPGTLLNLISTFIILLPQSKCKGGAESGTEEEMEGSKYSSKLLQRPHEVTAPILQCLRYVILSHDFLAHFVALGVQAFVEWGVHVVL